MWGLVNNAGISTFGEVEFTSLETYKEVAEVNLWGTVRTTKSFLPLLRRAKGELRRQLLLVPWTCSGWKFPRATVHSSKAELMSPVAMLGA